MKKPKRSRIAIRLYLRSELEIGQVVVIYIHALVRDALIIFVIDTDLRTNNNNKTPNISFATGQS